MHREKERLFLYCTTLTIEAQNNNACKQYENPDNEFSIRYLREAQSDVEENKEYINTSIYCFLKE